MIVVVVDFIQRNIFIGVQFLDFCKPYAKKQLRGFQISNIMNAARFIKCLMLTHFGDSEEIFYCESY